jgi:hypothetical protein
MNYLNFFVSCRVLYEPIFNQERTTQKIDEAKISFVIAEYVNMRLQKYTCIRTTHVLSARWNQYKR